MGAGVVEVQRGQPPGDVTHRPVRDRPTVDLRDTGDLAHGAGAEHLVGRVELDKGDIADLGAWSREMARVLTLNGHLVYSDFHPSWAQRGWSRTFRSADGTMHDVAFHPHTLDDHLAALAQAGLQVRAIREPRLAPSRDDREPALKIFRRRPENPQVVIVFHVVKEP